MAQRTPGTGSGPGGTGDQQRRPSPQSQQKGRAQAHYGGPGTAGQTGRLRRARPDAFRAVPGGRRLRRRFRQASTGQRVSGDPAVARQDPQHLGSRRQRSPGQPGSAQHCRGHRCRSGCGRHQPTALRQDLHPRRRRLRRPAHCHIAVRAVRPALPPTGGCRSRLRRDATAVPYRHG